MDLLVVGAIGWGLFFAVLILVFIVGAVRLRHFAFFLIRPLYFHVFSTRWRRWEDSWRGADWERGSGGRGRRITIREGGSRIVHMDFSESAEIGEDLKT